MAEINPELLNTVYKEIAEKLGMDTAKKIYRMFKGQQISFLMRLFTPSEFRNVSCRNTTDPISRPWQ